VNSAAPQLKPTPSLTIVASLRRSMDTAMDAAYSMMLSEAMGVKLCYCKDTLVQGVCPNWRCPLYGQEPDVAFCKCTTQLTQCGKCPNNACPMFGKTVSTMSLRDSTLDPQQQPDYAETNQRDDTVDLDVNPRIAEADESDVDSVIGHTLRGTLHGTAPSLGHAEVVAGRKSRDGDTVKRLCTPKPLDKRSLGQFFIHFRLAVEAENDLDSARALIRLALLADGYAWGEAKKPNGTVQRYSSYVRSIMEHLGLKTVGEACSLLKDDVETAIAACVRDSSASCRFNKREGRARSGAQMPHKVEQNHFTGWGTVRDVVAKNGGWLAAVVPTQKS